MEETKDIGIVVKRGRQGSIGTFVERQYFKAKDKKYSDEQRMMESYRNFRGLWAPDTKWRENEDERVFVKITKTKTMAAYGQLADVLLGSDRFPLTIDPTTLPDGVEEAVHFDPTQPAAPEQSIFDMDLGPGETLDDLRSKLGASQKKLEPIADSLKPGEGTTPTSITIHPAMESAKKMEKKIHDQLEESNAKNHLRMVAFDCALYGTGIMKGPFIKKKEYPRWTEEGVYDPEEKDVPTVESVSVWNIYPDPDATCIEDSEYIVQRHKYGRSQMHALKKRPGFDRKVIQELMDDLDYIYTEEWWEKELDDNAHHDSPERFEILEYWGYMDKKMLEGAEVTLPENSEDLVAMNVWVCDGRVLRCVANPFNPIRLPYHAVPYELNPNSFFGVGIAENMVDSQTLINGFMRLAVDNAVLSGNVVWEIHEDHITEGQDLTVYPGKTFRVESGGPGQSIRAIEIPNISGQILQMMEKSNQIADQSTGFPSFAHGQPGVDGIGRTAAGTSMWMNAANTSTKNAIKNMDDYLLAPLGRALYFFNMQFDYDKELVGDYEVKARGTESLLANEVRSQRLLQFLGVVQNPMLAPFAKMDYIIREIAKSLDLDPEKVVNSMSDAAIQAQVLQQMQGMAGGDMPPGGDGMTAEGAPGIGAAPQPGMEGFTGPNEPPQGSI